MSSKYWTIEVNNPHLTGHSDELVEDTKSVAALWTANKGRAELKECQVDVSRSLVKLQFEDEAFTDHVRYLAEQAWETSAVYPGWEY
ncbi:hypothetical protein JCM8547_004242 [Rhodosporidiobolus lusitaniae]